MSNVLFLDIDGVLLPFGSYNDWYLAEAMEMPDKFMEDCSKRVVGVKEIKEFCDNNDAQLVLISTWRYIFKEVDLREFIEETELDTYFHIDWIAIQESAFRKTKAQDISHWLMRHQEVDKWWVLDDQDQGVPEGHWIKTDPYVGYQGEYIPQQSPV